LPPVGQLAGHHIVLLHAQARQAHRDAICHAGKFTVGEALFITSLNPVSGKRQLVRAGGHAGVKFSVDGAVMPQTLRDHAGAARGQKYGIEFHSRLLGLVLCFENFRLARFCVQRGCAR
jgi:hypothetical protein